jgi:hypothetical protein
MGLREVLKKVSVINATTDLSSHKVNLALIDELANIKMEAGSLLVLQKQQFEAAQKLDQSITLNKKGLAEAQRGLKAATDLGEPKGIEIFKNYVKSFTADITRAEKGKKLVAALSNV